MTNDNNSSIKQVNIHGPDDVRIDDAPPRELGSNDAIIRVVNCGICGTDLRYVRMGGMSRPMALGHELSGVVEVLGDKGITDVLAVDLSAKRLELAKQLGAHETINAGSGKTWDRIKELHGTAPLMGTPMAGSDAYIEATGAGSVITDVLQNAKPRARLTVVALHEKSVSISFLWVMMKQLTICGAMEYPEDYSDTLALLSRWDLSPMVTHRFPLEQFVDALAIAKDPNLGGKVMIDIEGASQ